MTFVARCDTRAWGADAAATWLLAAVIRGLVHVRWHGGPGCGPDGHRGRADMPTPLLAQAQAVITNAPRTALLFGDVARRASSNPETLERG